MTEIKVYLDAMTKYADAMDKIGEDFGATEQKLYDADVTEDSFGMLSESREAAKVYEQRTTDGLDVLKARRGDLQRSRRCLPGDPRQLRRHRQGPRHQDRRAAVTRPPSGSVRIEEWLGPAGAAYGIIKPIVDFLAHPIDAVTGDPDQLRAKGRGVAQGSRRPR